MKELAILLRALQLYAHLAHNLSARSTFFSDHSFFAEIYEAADDNYDSVIERMIGLYGEAAIPDLQEQMNAMNALTQHLPQKGVKDNEVFFQVILEKQKLVCGMIEKLCSSGLPQGTIQMLGDISNQSEGFQYKLKQRLKK